MSAIDACLRMIRRKIPKQILDATFIEPGQRLFGAPASIENQIVEKVMKDIVIPDLSQFGQLKEIDLTGLPYENSPNDQFTRIYHIDETRTGGLDIIAAHLVGTPIAGQAYTIPPAGSYLTGSASGVVAGAELVINSHSAQPRLTSEEVVVLGPNTVSVKDPGMFQYGTRLKVRTMFSQELNEIKPPFYPAIAQLATWATKQHIYNNLSLDLDIARLENGVSFDKFKDFVEEYRDAGESYDDQLLVCKRALVHNDDQGNRDNYRSAGRFSA
ncbi:hypothetical protein PHOBOS_8 [Erwinia phage vB_EamM_Phobos]|uniref:hypothetical protein n=1 Tax=Erwinia phage vB_EamM_Phobos TaxID=1883377 RepID=UPI00081CB260|nr:hypothetical protein BIZ79_gp008 [Erwinia phage vB_EamM_Phobos]ANZ50198.1 hypothetical protein PHOBOS_8 [Erwinia phage vB_EamM_Phobos]